MASILEDDDLSGNPGKDPTDPVVQSPEPKEPAAAPVEDKLGKFKGKTQEEIAAAYAELEQRFGAQGAEIGELRKFTDSLIRSDLERRKTPEAPSKTEPQTADDDALFFTNPKEAIRKAIREDELLKELAQHKSETQQERARRVTLEKHPDADSIVVSPEFEKWVKGSRVRVALYNSACNFDSDAAIELFDTFKALHPTKPAETAPVKNEAPDTSVVDAQRKAAGAAVGSAGGGQGDDSAKPVYSRRKIMDLMTKNPEEYAARSDEFLAAYAEGRVKA